MAAGHWIKWEKGLERKPETVRIAKALNVAPLHAAAMCMMVWAWADDNSTDGVIHSFTPEDISTVVGLPGIAEAMADTHWLVVSASGVQFPNYDRHNGSTAKARALDAARKRVDRLMRGGRVRT